MNNRFFRSCKAMAIIALLTSLNTVSAQTSEPDSATPNSSKFTSVIAEKGSVTTAEVQDKRDAGWGWGAIAKALGFNLGSAVSAANQDRKADRQDTTTAALGTGNRSNGGEGSRGNGNGGGSGGGGGNGGGNGGGGGRR